MQVQQVPRIQFLADAFKTTKPSTVNSKSFVPTRTTTMTCPANFPTVALPPTRKGKDSDAEISLMRMHGGGVVPILECSVYQPKCNGGLANKQQRYMPDNTTGVAKLQMDSNLAFKFFPIDRAMWMDYNRRDDL
ncbi:hypothetical protein AaE_011443 [Aphanomyces astaci]|uniref:Uncharacterized protein n=1 Tax=Aphanomyces astaci TaxID=112090 RepID=A0A6A4ZE45_APHAT|nr:hypothetical protein AaE_011443 [Aphanomyces astaci]